MFGHATPKLVALISGGGDEFKTRFAQNLIAAATSLGYVAHLHRPRQSGEINLQALARESDQSRHADLLLFDLPECDAADRLFLAEPAINFLLVTQPTAACLKRSYLSLRGLVRDLGRLQVGCVVAGVNSDVEGNATAKGLSAAAESFLAVPVRYFGNVPNCPFELRSRKTQRPVTVAFPDSPASQAFKIIANNIMHSTVVGIAAHRSATSRAAQAGLVNI
jgi:MinD-like ATPase involved in chromosome partitioning or flagellar assembly